MFRFEHPEYFLALLGVLALGALYYFFEKKRAAAVSVLGGEDTLNRLQHVTQVPRRRQLKAGLLLCAAAAMVTALANPQLGAQRETVKRKGTDLLIALDVSKSMNAADIEPSRLERAKRFAQKLIDQQKGDRVGVIVFAGNAYLQVPLTADYNAASSFIADASPDIAPTQGTAIGAALRLAIKVADIKDATHKALVVITDGEEHDDDAISAAKEAGDKGIVISTIGVGTTEGAPIPLPDVNGTGHITYLQNGKGEMVITKVNPLVLTEVANAGKGVYYDIKADDAALADIKSRLEQLEKQEFEQRSFSRYESYFQYPLALAIILIMVEFFLVPFRRRTQVTAILVLCCAYQVSAQTAHKSIRAGNAVYNKGDYTTAEEHYRRALDKDGKSIKATFNLGDAIYQQANEQADDATKAGRYGEAAKQFEAAEANFQTPKDKSKASYNTGNAYYQKAAASSKNVDEAVNALKKSVEAYKNALRKNPADAEAKHNLALAQKQLKQKQQEQKEEQEKKKNEKKDEKKDQQNQDKQNQQDQQNQQNQDKQNQQDKQQPQNGQQQKMTPEDAKRLLQIMTNEERKAQQKILKAQDAGQAQPDKDW